MADLTYLNEGAVLHNLKQRYYYRLIYVSIHEQPILIERLSFFSLSLFFFGLFQRSTYKPNKSQTIRTRRSKSKTKTKTLCVCKR